MISARTPAKLTMGHLSARVTKSEYAVRGVLPLLAKAISEKLAKQPDAYPFSKVTQVNIGNPQIFAPHTVSLPRLVLGEVMSRSKEFSSSGGSLQGVGAGAVLGDFEAYISQFPANFPSPAGGWPFVRETVAAFLRQRDGLDAEAGNIILTSGASKGIQTVLGLLLREQNSGVMLPIPQYPLYSATTTILGGTLVPYYLDESHNWNVDLESAEAELLAAERRGVRVKAIVLINPGNPTGNVFDRDRMEGVLELAARHRLVVLADEVYQENIYCDKPWRSFKAVLAEMRPTVRDAVGLVSFHSVSKGVLGECGLRGGYLEMLNMPAEFRRQVLANEGLAPVNLAGQVVLDVKSRLLMDFGAPTATLPPLIAEARSEYNALFSALKIKAAKFGELINQVPGLSSCPIEGAMYAFPRLELPLKFVEKAEIAGVAPDVRYCVELLEATGICAVPGSGFGQKSGTYHLRTTILPAPQEVFFAMLEKFSGFQSDFLRRYAS